MYYGFRKAFFILELAPQWKEEGSRYIVKQDKVLNSRRADYCPMFLDKNHDYVYLTSTNEKSTGELRSEITGTKKGDIYFSKKDEKGVWSRPEVVDGGLNTEHDEGAAAFTELSSADTAVPASVIVIKAANTAAERRRARLLISHITPSRLSFLSRRFLFIDFDSSETNRTLTC